MSHVPEGLEDDLRQGFQPHDEFRIVVPAEFSEKGFVFELRIGQGIGPCIKTGTALLHIVHCHNFILTLKVGEIPQAARAGTNYMLRFFRHCHGTVPVIDYGNTFLYNSASVVL